MNTKRQVVVSLVLCLSLLIVVVACVGQPDVVGKWRQIDSQPNNDVQFFKDGTFIWGMFSGKFSFPEDGHIKLEMIGMAGVYKISFSEDTVTLVGETALDRGKTFVLQRTK